VRPAFPPRPPVVVPPARLTVELVPKTSWYNNVRALVDELGWDRIRRQVYRQAEYRCEICGGRGPEHPVECHEVWRYDDRTRTQMLVRMIALCPACHQVKHIGLANVKGKGAQARGHLARVNGWTLAQADTYPRPPHQDAGQAPGVASLGAAAYHPVGTDDFPKAALSPGSQVQMVLQQPPQQLPTVDRKPRLQLGMRQLSRLRALQPAHHHRKPRTGPVERLGLGLGCVCLHRAPSSRSGLHTRNVPGRSPLTSLATLGCGDRAVRQAVPAVHPGM
jgi:hypothetical protein